MLHVIIASLIVADWHLLATWLLLANGASPPSHVNRPIFLFVCTGDVHTVTLYSLLI